MSITSFFVVFLCLLVIIDIVQTFQVGSKYWYIFDLNSHVKKLTFIWWEEHTSFNSVYQRFLIYTVCDKINEKGNQIYYFSQIILIFIIISVFTFDIIFSQIKYTFLVIFLMIVFYSFCIFSSTLCHFFAKMNMEYYAYKLDLNTTMERQKMLSSWLTPEEFYHLYPLNTEELWHCLKNFKFFLERYSLFLPMTMHLKQMYQIISRIVIAVFVFYFVFFCLKYSYPSKDLTFMFFFVPLFLFLPKYLDSRCEQEILDQKNWEDTHQEWLKRYKSWYFTYFLNYPKPWI